MSNQTSNEQVERCYNDSVPAGRCVLPYGHQGLCKSEEQAEIERLRALIKKAGDLLTYGGPDMELQADDGSDWIDKCDEWFKAADYGMPKPRPADETESRLVGVDVMQPSDEQWCNVCGQQGHTHCTGGK